MNQRHTAYKAAALTTELLHHIGRGREIRTPAPQTRPDSLANCSLNLLSIPRHLVVKAGLEPATPGSSLPRSTNWSYFTTWVERRESNPHHSEPQSDALPFKLPPTYLAAPAGVEPAPSESESDILPLDEGAIRLSRADCMFNWHISTLLPGSLLNYPL